jgi:hypothetical protein
MRREPTFYSLSGGLRTAWYAVRKCDERFHIECHRGHEIRREDEEWTAADENGVRIRSGPKHCPTCSAEVIARPSRDTMLSLARQQVKGSLLPRWTTAYKPGGPKRRVLYWRSRRLWSGDAA